MAGGNGHMSAIAMRAKLPNFALKNRSRGTAAEYRAKGQGSLAYFGTYSVEGTDLVIRVKGSS
jgi:hypothetical protein